MDKWVCKVCGYIYEGAEPPAECPVCHAPASQFEKVEGELKLAAEHEYGIYDKTVKDNPDISDEDKAYILEQLKANFTGECSEVGMYLCMARVAHREGYPEIGLYWEKAAYEEAEHAAKFAELLGEVVHRHPPRRTSRCASTAENGATAGKVELAKLRQGATTSTPSTTPSTRWLATRPVTARPSRACSSATSAKSDGWQV